MPLVEAPAPARPPQSDPLEALIEEARAHRRRRRLRLCAVALALAVAAGLAAGLAHVGGGRRSVERVPGGPVVNVHAFAGHGRLAFVSGATLWVLDGARGALRRVATPRGYMVPQSPAFSPDGRWLAYVEASPNLVTPSRLWLAHGDGADARVVPGLANLTLVGWAPHGDVLAVAAGPERTKAPCPCSSPTTIRLVSPDGSSRVLARGSWIDGAAWSPRGVAIAVGIEGRRTATLASYPVAGGKRTVWLQLAARDRLNGMNEILVEPAGWWRGFGIGFWVFGDGMVHNNDATPLDVIGAPGGRPRLLAQTLSDGTTDVLAANGRGTLAVVADVSHGSNGGRVVWDKKQLQVCGSRACVAPVASSSKVTVDPAWSPDGRTLAFAEAPDFAFPGWPQRFMQRWYAKHVLQLYDLGTRKLQTIRAAKGATVPAWSPDGKSLLYVAGDGLWLLPSLSSAPVEIASPLFTQRRWPAYYGQVAWMSQFAWWSS